MIKRIYWMVLTGMLATLVGAQETNNVGSNRLFRCDMSATLASSYIYRGATLNDGWVLQPCVETTVGFLKAGAWANYDINDYAGAIDGNKFSEVDLYASFNVSLGRWDMAVGYKAYLDKYFYLEEPAVPEFTTKQEVDDYKAEQQAIRAAYPKPNLGQDDASEVFVSVAYNARFIPSISVSHGIDGCLEKTTYVEGKLAHEYYRSPGKRMVLSAAVYYIDQENNLNGFSHCLLANTFIFNSMTATIGFIGPLDGDILTNAREGGPLDMREYASLGFSYGF